MSAFSAEEVRRLRALLEEDEIRKLRNLYSQYMDAAQIEDLASLFTEDGVCEFGPNFGRWEGRETIREKFQEVEDGAHGAVFAAMHSTSNHWVELTGPDTAVGRSYLIDMVTRKAADENPLVIVGVYEDAYRKLEGRWLIERCSLQFLWPQRNLTEGFPAPLPPR
jgi:ketosteroid isomerase-like protein